MYTVQQATRWLLRNLAIATSDLATTTTVTDRGDATEIVRTKGFVTFMYDPWQEEELVLWVYPFTFKGVTITDPFLDETGRFAVDPKTYYGLPTTTSPAIGTMYQVDIVESWNVLTIDLDDMRDGTANRRIIIDCNPGERFGAEQTRAIEEVDHLLDGKFHRTQPVHDWFDFEN